MTKLILNFIIAVGVLAAGTIEVLGQSKEVAQNTITWVSSSNIDIKTAQSFTQPLKFITHTDQKVELVGKAPQYFLITAVRGQWKDIGLRGAITFEVEIDEQKGLIHLKKDRGGVFLEIDLSISFADGIHRKYIIDSVKIN
jgi:hypothetical protein